MAAALCYPMRVAHYINMPDFASTKTNDSLIFKISCIVSIKKRVTESNYR